MNGPFSIFPIHQFSPILRKRLTSGGKPNFESFVLGKYKKREQSFFQINHDCIFQMQAELIGTDLVLWSFERRSQFTPNLATSRFFLYINTDSGIAFASQPTNCYIRPERRAWSHFIFCQFSLCRKRLYCNICT